MWGFGTRPIWSGLENTRRSIAECPALGSAKRANSSQRLVVRNPPAAEPAGDWLHIN